MATRKAQSIKLGTSEDVLVNPIGAFVDSSSAEVVAGSPIDSTATDRCTAYAVPVYKGMTIAAGSDYQFALYSGRTSGSLITPTATFLSSYTASDELGECNVSIKRRDGGVVVPGAGAELSDYVTLDYSGVDLYWEATDYTLAAMANGLPGSTASNRVRTSSIYLYEGLSITANSGYELRVYNRSSQITPSNTWVESFTIPRNLPNGYIVVRRPDDSDIDLAVSGDALSDYVTLDYSAVYSARTDLTHVFNDSTVRYLDSKWGIINERKWRGKKAVFVGDSITAGTGTTPGHVYYNYLDSIIGFSSVVAMGVAGSCYSVTSSYGTLHSPIASRASDVPADADLVVLFAGTNDWGHNTPMGTMADTTDVSFYGALYVTLSTIISANPDVRLVMMTPLHRYGFGAYADDMGPNGQGLTLSAYVDAIKAMAARFGVPVIDTYSMSGLCPYIEDIKTDYMPDGLHPNAAGHELLADRIYMWLGLM